MGTIHQLRTIRNLTAVFRFNTRPLLFAGFFLLVLFIIFPVMSADALLSLTDEEKAWLKEYPVIRIGVMDAWPPFSFIDKDGMPQGISIDIVKVLNRRLQGRLEMVPGAWKQIYNEVKEGRLDAIIDITPKPIRQEHFNFTTPYLDVPHVIVAPKDVPFISNEDDLKGMTLALEKGFGNVRHFKDNYPQVRIKEYRDTAYALDAVVRGEADAYAGNRGVAIYLMKEEVMTNLQIHGRLKKSGSILAIGTRKGLPILRDILQKALDSITHKEHEEIRNRWVRIEAPGKKIPVVPLTSQERVWLKEHPIIRLGVDPEFAPFEYIAEDGTYSGITSDYIKLLNERLGLNMKVIPDLTWREAVEKAKIREIDVLPCVGITEERKAFLNYSTPYINFHRVIITRTDTPFLVGLEDISNLKVAVQVNTSHEGYLKDNTDIKPDLYKTLKEALLAVSDGKSDAFVGNIASSTYWIRKLNLTNLKVAAPVSLQETQQLHFAVRKDWPKLVNIINKGLASISPEEETEIRQRWVAVEYKPGINPKIVWEYILKITGVAFLVLVAFTIWNYSLKREVNKRRKAEKELHKAHDELEDRVEERTSELADTNKLLKDEIAERRKAEEELEKHRMHLEDLVNERTVELEVKNRELERFNDLFVDREFRIKELREKVKKLETGN